MSAGPSERIPLWRAVSEAELADTCARGIFRVPETETTYAEGKLFAETAQGAGAGKASMGSTIARGERFTVVQTDIAADCFRKLYVFPDATNYGPVPSRLVPTDVLPELSPPQIQDVLIFRKP